MYIAKEKSEIESKQNSLMYDLDVHVSLLLFSNVFFILFQQINLISNSFLFFWLLYKMIFLLHPSSICQIFVSSITIRLNLFINLKQTYFSFIYSKKKKFSSDRHQYWSESFLQNLMPFCPTYMSKSRPWITWRLERNERSDMVL